MEIQAALDTAAPDAASAEADVLEQVAAAVAVVAGEGYEGTEAEVRADPCQASSDCLAREDQCS